MTCSFSDSGFLLLVERGVHVILFLLRPEGGVHVRLVHLRQARLTITSEQSMLLGLLCQNVSSLSRLQAQATLSCYSTS